MRTFALLLSATAVATAGLTAAAASPPPCRLLVDPSGDVTDRSNPANLPALDEPAADLVSADVASNGTYLTVDVRPRAFRLGPSSELYHQVFLWVGRVPYRFDYAHDLTGTTYTAYHNVSEDLYSEDVEIVPGAFGTEDTARGEIRMSIRRRSADGVRPRVRLRPEHVALRGARVRGPTSGSCSSTTSAPAAPTSRPTTRAVRTLAGYADDVLEICRRSTSRDVVFVGHSVSAMIGVLAAVPRPRRSSRSW
jgi:hypothetical protein